MSERYLTRPALTAAAGCLGALVLAVVCAAVAIGGGFVVAGMQR